MEKLAFYKLSVHVSVLERGLGGAFGVDKGWLPLPAHLQQYCDTHHLISVITAPAHLQTTSFAVFPALFLMF